MLWRIYYAKYEVLGDFVQIFYCCVIHIKKYCKMKYSDDQKIEVFQFTSVTIQIMLLNFRS